MVKATSINEKNKASILQADQKNNNIKEDVTRLRDAPEGEDGFISNELYQKWEGLYIMENNDVIDGWGRESTSHAELNMIKPDSCIFKSWLADNKGKRYGKHDNYQEYIGGIFATPNNDSIEFLPKE
ncbi:hypothetical protein [Chryseobacterium contaminans]|uniref:hypothetical protein n=1 Tax=Chryseobacterium contaminans TaxID=1423959 RepID=UPI003018CB93